MCVCVCVCNRNLWLFLEFPHLYTSALLKKIKKKNLFFPIKYKLQNSILLKKKTLFSSLTVTSTSLKPKILSPDSFQEILSPSFEVATLSLFSQPFNPNLSVNSYLFLFYFLKAQTLTLPESLINNFFRIYF